MDRNPLESPQHQTVKRALRIGGPILLLTGLLFVIVGTANFFMAMGGSGPPRLFWCNFVGLPLMFAGGVLTQLGYLGAVMRYVNTETAPVAKDSANYLGQEIQPGVKAVAKAVTEGVLEAQREDGTNS